MVESRMALSSGIRPLSSFVQLRQHTTASHRWTANRCNTILTASITTLAMPLIFNFIWKPNIVANVLSVQRDELVSPRTFLTISHCLIVYLTFMSSLKSTIPLLRFSEWWTGLHKPISHSTAVRNVSLAGWEMTSQLATPFRPLATGVTVLPIGTKLLWLSNGRTRHTECSRGLQLNI